MEAVGLAERILVSANESIFAIEQHPIDKVEGGRFSAELPDSIAGSVVVGLDNAAVLQVEGRHQIDQSVCFNQMIDLLEEIRVVNFYVAVLADA